MIDLALSLIEKIVELLKERKQIKRLIFSDHLDPIYNDVDRINQNYHEIYDEILRQITDPNVEIRSVIDSLATKRKELLGVREKASVYLAALTESDQPDEIKKLCGAFMDILMTGPLTERPPEPRDVGVSRPRELLYSFQLLFKQHSPRESYLLTANDWLNRLDVTARAARIQYYKTRVEYLKP